MECLTLFLLTDPLYFQRAPVAELVDHLTLFLPTDPLYFRGAQIAQSVELLTCGCKLNPGLEGALGILYADPVFRMRYKTRVVYCYEFVSKICHYVIEKKYW